jgi:hypothetical protein
MRTEQDIKKHIRVIKKNCRHIITGPVADLRKDPTTALLQVTVESELRALHWVLEERYISQLSPADE